MTPTIRIFGTQEQAAAAAAYLRASGYPQAKHFHTGAFDMPCDGFVVQLRPGEDAYVSAAETLMPATPPLFLHQPPDDATIGWAQRLPTLPDAGATRPDHSHIHFAIQVLNDALERDPATISGLLHHCRSTNYAMTQHPTIQTEQRPDGLGLSVLGLLNGLFGIRKDESGWIAAIADREHPYRIHQFLYRAEPHPIYDQIKHDPMHPPAEQMPEPRTDIRARATDFILARFDDALRRGDQQQAENYRYILDALDRYGGEWSPTRNLLITEDIRRAMGVNDEGVDAVAEGRLPNISLTVSISDADDNTTPVGDITGAEDGDAGARPDPEASGAMSRARVLVGIEISRAQMHGEKQKYQDWRWIRSILDDWALPAKPVGADVLGTADQITLRYACGLLRNARRVNLDEDRVLDWLHDLVVEWLPDEIAEHDQRWTDEARRVMQEATVHPDSIWDKYRLKNEYDRIWSAYERRGTPMELVLDAALQDVMFKIGNGSVDGMDLDKIFSTLIAATNWIRGCLEERRNRAEQMPF